MATQTYRDFGERRPADWGKPGVAAASDHTSTHDCPGDSDIAVPAITIGSDHRVPDPNQPLGDFNDLERTVALRPDNPWLHDQGYWSEPEERVKRSRAVRPPTKLDTGNTELICPIFERNRIDPGRFYGDRGYHGADSHEHSRDDSEAWPLLSDQRGATWLETRQWLNEHGHAPGNTRKLTLYSTRVSIAQLTT